MRIKLTNIIFICLGLSPFFFWIYRYINVDLWYDEVYSLQQFALGSFANTLFNYPVPNNHVLFNFSSQLISRVLHIREIGRIAEYVYVFRLVQAAIACSIACYCVQILKRFFRLDHIFLVVPILFTTIPFMNFSLQLRGYNMSSLFLVMVVYHTLAFIKKGGKGDKLLLVGASALLIYTIPSNIYMLASLLLTLLLYLICHRKRSDAKMYSKAILFIVLGIGITTLLYLPILENIILNKFSAKEADSIFYSLELLPKLVIAFLSKRYLLVPVFIVGCWFFARESAKEERQILFFFILIFLIPFVLSFLHQRLPFQRIFTPLGPIFSILVTIPILSAMQKLKKHFALLATAYCVISFLNEVRNNDIEISDALIAKGEVTQDIYQNYYLSSSFNPMETAKHLASLSGNNPVILYEQIDLPATRLYLTINDVNFTDVYSKKGLESIIADSDTTIILSTFKKELTRELGDMSEIEIACLSDEYPISNILRVTKPKTAVGGI